MNFSSLLVPELIICDLTGNDRISIYTEMLNHLKMHYPEISVSSEELYNEIICHEELVLMPYQNGFAIPHTRSSAIDDFHIIIGIHKEGVMLKEDDVSASRIIIMSLISKSTSNIYLLALKAIVSFFTQEGHTDSAVQCKTAEELIEFLSSQKMDLEPTITAADIMLTDFPALNINATVRDAIDTIAKTQRREIPVINGSFQGSISIEDILHAGIPDYMLMMNSSAFLKGCEPFEQLLTKEDELGIKDFINKTPETCTPNTPLIQLIFNLLKKKVSVFYVLDEEEKLKGIISYRELVKRILRG
jgi:mannitol/fructose-specific phosphotransferase system IIA component (Ntr-type)/CBS domain-containing protein